MRIFSRNAQYQKFVVLKTNRYKRGRYGEFLVEGVRNINNALKNGFEATGFLYDAERSLSGWAKDTIKKGECAYALSGELMAELSGKEDTSELLGVFRMKEDRPEDIPLGKTPLLALFDRPSNHGNLGTVIRSMDALGMDGLLLTGHGVDPYDPAVISATMGSFFQLPFARIAENERLFAWLDGLRIRYPGFQIVGTTAHQEKRLDQVDFSRPTLLMIGNETDGLNRAYKEMADVLTTIPMAPEGSASSFNAACAATVMFYEARRQRGFFGKDE